MRTLRVALSACVFTAWLGSCGPATPSGGVSLCASSTHCVGDTDCPSGSRCNAALSLPSCQPLYCGGQGSACSAGYFCESQVCAASACFDPAQGTPAFGEVVPSTIHYAELADGGYYRRISFTTDARNDCAAYTANGVYGNSAVLEFQPATAQLVDGQVVTLVTDSTVVHGQGPNPSASFPLDQLSGLDLKHREGTVTVLHVPTPTRRDLILTIHVADGGLDGTYVATPVCP